MLPSESAFALLPLSRWMELKAIRPPGGYRLLLLDPPWHSASVARKGNYRTLDKCVLHRDLVPVLQALAHQTRAVIAVWVTNSRHVQEFVENALFPAVGAIPFGRWYWLKLDPNGSWTTGAQPFSAHRKPWEVLILGHTGTSPPPSLPTRLAIASTPSRWHSAKPPLDGLLQAAAHDLTREAPPGSPQAYGDEGGTSCAESLWSRLPKIELFAREVRPSWHAVGDETLLFQHTSLYERVH